MLSKRTAAKLGNLTRTQVLPLGEMTDESEVMGGGGMLQKRS